MEIILTPIGLIRIEDILVVPPSALLHVLVNSYHIPYFLRNMGLISRELLVLNLKHNKGIDFWNKFVLHMYGKDISLQTIQGILMQVELEYLKI